MGSNTETKCKDSRFPTPCGDDTCRPTYIDCLRALNDKEKQRNDQIKLGEEAFDGSVQPPNLKFKTDTWTYAQKGALRDPKYK